MMIKTTIDTKADSNAQVVSRILGHEITRGQLAAQLDRVKDKSNWKNPIDAEFTTATDEAASTLEVAIMREAVLFFCGCVPEIRHLGNFRFSVKAIGYYRAVGP